MAESRNEIKLHAYSQALITDMDGYTRWEKKAELLQWPAAQTGLIITDVWDLHWSRGATERVAAMVPAMNHFVAQLREKGVHIIHAPSDTMDYYENMSARQRLMAIPPEPPVQVAEVIDLPSPVDASDAGSDTGEKAEDERKVWTRQHAGIQIDQSRDVIGDKGDLIYSYLRVKGIKNLIYVGVHTNMCIIHRSFGIKKMKSYGFSCVLARDLTDAMYNPARPPYVSHEEGTKLVVDFIEKFYCPTLISGDVQL